jgi:pyrimidine deaminase RibD-like protein
MRASDFEIKNYPKLDKILSRLCDMIEQGQESKKKYGMVAAAVLDPDNRVVARLNSPGPDGKRIHAERAAMEAYNEQYGEIPPGSIVITTLSPCDENGTDMADHRVGSSCADYINASPVKKVYCGYMDPSQNDNSRQFSLMETADGDIRQQCKEYADTFLEENFADGRVNGKSRPGRVKRAGASCSGSVTDLRKRASNSSGERAKMYHWCANMKSGKQK